MTLIPAYGRDYDNQKAAVADFNRGKDFKICDITSRWDGKPANKKDLQAAGVRFVQIRYNQRRSVCVVEVAK
jgi:hypothetical protein